MHLSIFAPRLESLCEEELGFLGEILLSLMMHNSWSMMDIQ
jgi:hypothetical protein